eukprot:m.155964 g.155964  ORF g.155964 m.155964 type:complete len:301 (-) comp16426_c0_seq1:2073-2975(-)
MYMPDAADVELLLPVDLTQDDVKLTALKPGESVILRISSLVGEYYNKILLPLGVHETTDTNYYAIVNELLKSLRAEVRAKLELPANQYNKVQQKINIKVHMLIKRLLLDTARRGDVAGVHHAASHLCIHCKAERTEMCSEANRRDVREVLQDLDRNGDDNFDYKRLHMRDPSQYPLPRHINHLDVYDVEVNQPCRLHSFNLGPLKAIMIACRNILSKGSRKIRDISLDLDAFYSLIETADVASGGGAAPSPVFMGNWNGRNFKEMLSLGPALYDFISNHSQLYTYADAMAELLWMGKMLY